MELLFLITLFIIGLCVGSFLNVLADRLSNDVPITGRSRCDNCSKTLSWYELIPVISFIIQKQRCRSCKSKLSWSYPISELATGHAFVFTWLFIPRDFFAFVYPNINLLFQANDVMHWQVILAKILLLGIVSCCIVILLADFKYFIIPDPIQVAFAIFSFSLLLLGEVSYLRIISHLGAGIVVMVPMLAIFLLTKGNGLGFGDVKLAANVGLLAGLKGGVITFYLAFILGSLVGVVLLILRKQGLKSKLPFGPFIIIGLLLTIWEYQYWWTVVRYFFNW